MSGNVFSENYRVYYEDTDAGAVMYYANYLKFAERARTDMLREVGIVQSTLAETDGIFFVVRRAELDLRKPARLDDVVTIHTSIEKAGGASLVMLQRIVLKQDDESEVPLAEVKVVVACVNTDFQPTRLPTHIKQALV